MPVKYRAWCRSVVAIAAACLSCALAPARAVPAPLSATEIDRLAARTMTEFQVPGIALGIVKDGKLVYAKGYGVRELGTPAKVDADTEFAIGSNTKAFTTAALAILVDQGKLHWDDRVIDYLPEFRMADPYVTREFTIRDLLTHRSGLGTGAGDLLFVTPTDFTRADLIRALRYLKPVTGFRAAFAYDNLLYVVAGEVVAKASGQSWEDFVTARLLAPLHMDSCAVASARLPSQDNVAAPHSVVEGKLRTVARLEIPLVGPAGGIQCDVSGMARWVATQLARGVAPDGSRIFSAQQSTEMWTPQTILRPRGRLAEAARTHFGAYGLGWGLEDFDGYQRVSHNGGLPGMVTHVSMIPELGLGVIVLTNQQDGYALAAMADSILEGYTGNVRHDWVTLALAQRSDRVKQIGESDHSAVTTASVPAQVGTLALTTYAGTFEDPWRGKATIISRDNELRLTFSHTDGLVGALTPLGPDFFVVRWDDRSLNADAYVRFTRDFDGQIIGFAMKAVSASTDFSFDFQDLDFRKLPGEPPKAGR